MKKYINFLILGLFFSQSYISAQTLELNAESGDRAKEQANCWVFGATSYSNIAAHVITGSWAVRTNSLSNPALTATWIKSPWFKPGNGNITFKTKLENTGGTGGALNSTAFKAVVIRFIPYDATASYGEGAFLSEQFEYLYVSPVNSTVSLSYSIPSSVANSGQPYKIMISFRGAGGNNRANLDDLIIPGEYWSSPADGCMPKELVKDSDNDGIPDNEDPFPNDAERGLAIPYPSTGFGTLMYEDLWPATGDYDMNDFVVDYKFDTYTNAKNEVTLIEYTFVIRALGAGLQNGFAFQLDDIPTDQVISVSSSTNIKAGWFQPANNGAESGQKFVNIPVVDNAQNLFSRSSGSNFVNVIPTEPNQGEAKIVIAVKFNPISYNNLNAKAFNPYLIAGQDRGKEIHLANRLPSNKANAAYFGTEKDNSKPGSERYYVTENNLPWALNIGESIPYPIEKVDFTQAYLKFIKWAQDNGKSFSDWYKDNPGFRDGSKLMKK